MSDIFRELDEDMRRERMEKLWKKYGNLVIGLALLIVVAVAGWRGYQYFQQQASQAAAAEYEKAVQLVRDGKQDEAEKAFEKVAAGSPAGYRLLSRMRAAAQAAQRDPAAGIAAWKALAGDSSLGQTLQDLARLRAGMIAADTVPYDQLRTELEPLTATGNAWRNSARELLGVVAMKAGKNDDAAKWFDAIVIDRETPSSMRQRAETFQGMVAGNAAPQK
ncbi:MAG: tetratricopeptide repeat protein [Beijerinckiaceae bacterium]